MATRPDGDDPVDVVRERLATETVMTTLDIARLLRVDPSDAKRLLHSAPETFSRDSDGWRLRVHERPRRPRHPEAMVATSRNTAPRQIQPRGQVWVSGGGELYHYDEACTQLRSACADAYEAQGHVSGLRLVTLSHAETMGRRRCNRC